MSLKTIKRPAMTIVGLQIRTKPMSPEIPALWPRFVARIPEIPNQTEPRVAYGVMRDEAAMQVLLYMAGVAVASPAQTPRGMDSVVVPAGTYAEFKYPLSGLAKGFGEIYGRMLPTSDYVPVSGPSLEMYDESFDPNDPDSIVGIYIPVRRGN